MRPERARSTVIPALLCSFGILLGQQALAQGGGQGRPRPAPLRLTSTAFAEGAMIPTRFTCAAGPTAPSPALQWTDVPDGTVAFALIAHDLEPRPRGGYADILHWMIWNIPGSSMGLSEGVPASAELPDGTRQLLSERQGNTVGWRGPCPPEGVPVPHHYVFDLFALDVKLDLPATASRDELVAAIDGHILGHSALVGLFNR